MFIRAVSIKRLKCFSTPIDLSFTEDITLIYGGNGAGKTTILEAISLLGHLPCMSRFAVDTGRVPARRPPLFSTLVRDDIGSAFEPRGLAEQIAGSNTADWFDEFKGPGAAVRFEIAAARDSDSSIRFGVYFSESDPATGAPFSITRALSRRESGSTRISEMFGVVVDVGYDQERLDALIGGLDRTYPHTDGRRVLGPTTRRGNKVSLVHTDLNDFGLGYDIRESVKNLTADSVEEYVVRLGIPFDSTHDGLPRSFRCLPALRDVMARVIPAGGGSEGFQLAECRVDSLGRFILRGKHTIGEAAAPIDYLSNGENETFTIFLHHLGLTACQAHPANEGLQIVAGDPDLREIRLYDEPDLHIHELFKEAFYDQLFHGLRTWGHQAIVSTHSLYAFRPEHGVGRQFVRRIVKEGRLVYSTEEDPQFLLDMAASYLRVVRRSFHGVRACSPLQMQRRLWSNQWNDWFDSDPIAKKVAEYLWKAVVLFVVTNTFSSFSDFASSVGQPTETHLALAAWFGRIAAGLSAVIALLAAFAAFRLRAVWNKRHRLTSGR